MFGDEALPSFPARYRVTFLATSQPINDRGVRRPATDADGSAFRDGDRSEANALPYRSAIYAMLLRQPRQSRQALKLGDPCGSVRTSQN
jgi:hypothetical protein